MDTEHRLGVAGGSRWRGAGGVVTAGECKVSLRRDGKGLKATVATVAQLWGHTPNAELYPSSG